MHCEIIALFLTHCEFCEYKDQRLVKQMYCAWFFFYQLNFQPFRAILCDYKDVSDNKFCWLPHKKEQRFIVAEWLHFIWLIQGIIIEGLPSSNLFLVQNEGCFTRQLFL